ncbi:MAG: class I SAM-dependent methyltransferase [Terrisporobacter othiniensis]|uniref:class I SAM-dependent methyltransferase n=1 Tax=Terrisporobacter petrolearius TaxID=1460447 RepID=UPI0022E84D5A|nr:class I SAM-dependent methyltransferase [Terrisporobacter petrolearius]MDU4862133.1 class I SAM-dependent methyltransferase [Terrisporobacter othiniensis]MDU6995732.1 class I SAM-dependent methyltransferase [Terrisporobacter othiniensis]
MLNEKSNVDEIISGLQKYWNYRAPSYSKSNIEELNNFKRDAWLKILLNNAPKKEKLKVLDVGAGPGFFSILMSLAGHEVTAVDVSHKMIENAKQNARQYDVNINFVQVDGIHLPFEEKTFDFIISRNVLWNLEYPKEALKEWKRLLSDDGHVVYFDANQYLHLFDEKQKKLVEEDIRKMEILFNDKYEVTPEIEHLESIAQKLVLSNKKRPAWDVKALKECGYNLIRVEEDMGRYVWDEKQKVEQKSRPLFMVVAK